MRYLLNILSALGRKSYLFIIFDTSHDPQESRATEDQPIVKGDDRDDRD